MSFHVAYPLVYILVTKAQVDSVARGLDRHVKSATHKNNMYAKHNSQLRRMMAMPGAGLLHLNYTALFA